MPNADQTSTSLRVRLRIRPRQGTAGEPEPDIETDELRQASLGYHKDFALEPDERIIMAHAVDSPAIGFGKLYWTNRRIILTPNAVKFAGGSSPGSMDHLAFCKVAKLGGINPKELSYVAFSGGGEALTTLLGGNVAFVSSGIGETLPQLQAGTVRALAVTSPKRLGGPLKDVPTLIELGINTTYEVWRGAFGAPGMSKDAQAWWAKTLKTMVGTKTWKDSLEKLQWVDAYASAEEFTKFLVDEEKSYRELMTDLGFAK